MDETDLYYYSEGQLSKAYQRSIEEHLLRCSDCREKVVSIIDDFPQPLAEPDGSPSSTSDFDIDQMLTKILPGMKRLYIH